MYIKAGQHIGALDYLLPDEYVQTMKVLHDDAPKSQLNDVIKVTQSRLFFQSLLENELKMLVYFFSSVMPDNL